MGRKSYKKLEIPPEIEKKWFVLGEEQIEEDLFYRKVLGEKTDIVQIVQKSYLVSQVVGQRIRYVEDREEVMEEAPLEILVSRFLDADELKLEIKTEKVTDLEEQRKVGLVLRLKGFRGKMRFD